MAAKYGCKEVLGKLCWTAAMAAKAIGVKKGTVLAWARRKREYGEFQDLVVFGGKVKGSTPYFPIKDFLEWYGYEGQN